MRDEVEITSHLSTDAVAAQLASRLDPVDFKGWPRKALTGEVRGREFIIMKRRRNTMDLNYFAGLGSLSNAASGTKISVSFVRSFVATFLRFAWLPMGCLVLLGNIVATVAAAVSGGPWLGFLAGAGAAGLLLLVGWALHTGLKSSNAAERQEILSYLRRVGAGEA